MNPLSQLKAIHLPQTISFWPATPAWYILFTLLGIGMLYGTFRFLVYRQKRQRYQFIRQQFADAVALYAHQPQQSLAQISILLRRVAISAYTEQQVAGLHGQAWLRFLDGTANTTAFSEGIGQVLLNGPYQKHHNVDIHKLDDLLQHWLKKVLGG